jgi:hypothetical protein
MYAVLLTLLLFSLNACALDCPSDIVGEYDDIKVSENCSFTSEKCNIYAGEFHVGASSITIYPGATTDCFSEVEYCHYRVSFDTLSLSCSSGLERSYKKID